MWVKTCSPGGCTTRWHTTTPHNLLANLCWWPVFRCWHNFYGQLPSPWDNTYYIFCCDTFRFRFFLRPKPLDLCLTDIASPCHVGAMVESNYNFWIPWMVGLFFLRFALVYEAHTSQEDCHSQFSCIYPGDLPVLSSNYEFISLQSVAPEIIDKQCWRSIGTAAACLFGLKNAVDKDSMPLLKSYNIQVMKS